jgi:hypothetical protein
MDTVCGLLISRNVYVNCKSLGLNSVVPQFIVLTHKFDSFGNETDVQSTAWTYMNHRKLEFMKLRRSYF